VKAPTDKKRLEIRSDISAERRERLLFACRHQWELTGDPTALIEALGYLRPRLPSWLEVAIVRTLSDARNKAQRKVHTDDERHAFRYLQVRHFESAGATWEDAYDQAAEALAGTWAAGEPLTMKASYQKVKADLDAGQINRYQIWRDRHLG
jgi:hypothetical protein